MMSLAQEEDPKFTPWYSKKRQRLMYKPNTAMRQVHAEQVAWLKSLSIPMPSAHAFVEKRSSLTNAIVHQYGRYFYITDLTNAYGTLRPQMMADVLMKLDPECFEGDKLRLTKYLSRYFFLRNGGLYTGGPASPIMFNAYCAVRLDEPLSRYCQEHGLQYTRYADDLTFSSELDNIGSSKRDQIRSRVREAGFEPNSRKTRINLDLSKAPIRIAGVLLHWTDAGHSARMTAPRAQRERAKTVMGMALRGDVSQAIAHGHVGATLAVTRGVEHPDTQALRVDNQLQKPMHRTNTG